MSDDNLLADLIRAGTDPDLVARVAAALAIVRDSPGHVRDIVRAYERGRKKTQREKSTKSGGKQTMSASIKKAEGNESVRDRGSARCNLTSFSSSAEVQRRKEEKSSKRGTRMQAGAVITEVDWQFARDQGFNDTQIKTMWAEFVDFWIGIPGDRGLKLNWSATWRNRVRTLKDRKGAGNGAGTGTMAAVDDLIAREKIRSGDFDGPLLDLTPTSSRTS